MSEDFVGVFDSGVGGISVLRQLVHELPQENFCFFGDSAHAPYGEKSDEEVRRLCTTIVDRMVKRGAKAIVIACNTATSVAASDLRAHYDLPIIGVEPALKPACEAFPKGHILVMATPITLRLDKFQHLVDHFGSDAEVSCVPCPGLAARIEQGNLGASDLYQQIAEFVGPFRGRVDAVVLGCTHYPFIRKQISEVLGDVVFFDGAAGTARQLRRVLEARGLMKQAGALGSVNLSSSLDTPEELELYKKFFDSTL